MKSHIGINDTTFSGARVYILAVGVWVEELNIWHESAFKYFHLFMPVIRRISCAFGEMNYMEQPVDVIEQSTNYDNRIGDEILQVPWWVVLLEGIIAILLGLFLLYRPAATTVFLIQILGIFWLAEGILSFIGALIFSGNRIWKLLSGILSIIAGALILMYPIYSPLIVLTLFIVFIGIWAIINGVVKIALALKGGGWGIGIIGILTIILGMFLLTNSLIGILFLPWIFGFFLILGGIGSLMWGLKMRT
jgi:uncharacterized membrane protein HdeD (DUF308 family)